MAKRIVIKLDFTEAAAERLKRLQELLQTKRSDVIRRALRILDYAVEGRNDGKRLVLIDRAGKQHDLEL